MNDEIKTFYEADLSTRVISIFLIIGVCVSISLMFIFNFKTYYLHIKAIVILCSIFILIVFFVRFLDAFKKISITENQISITTVGIQKILKKDRLSIMNEKISNPLFHCRRRNLLLITDETNSVVIDEDTFKEINRK